MVTVPKSLWRSPNFCPMQRQIKNITLGNLVCSRIAVKDLNYTVPIIQVRIVFVTTVNHLKDQPQIISPLASY